MIHRPSSLILAIAFFCLLIVFVSLFIIFSRPFDVRALDVRFMVGDSVGLEINTSSLTFGRVLPDTVSSRVVFIDNPYSFPVGVTVLIDPSLNLYLTTAEPSFTIEPLSRYNASFTLLVPSGTAFGSYEGSLKFEFRR
ncbi:MAG: hypothetical protein AABX53_00300 [Nanoarchaeota archaeon]